MDSYSVAEWEDTLYEIDGRRDGRANGACRAREDNYIDFESQEREWREALLKKLWELGPPSQVEDGKA